MDAIRPSWDFKLTEGEFRTLSYRRIVRVEHAWRFLTEDRSESWINLIMNDNGDDKGDTVQIASHRMPAFLDLFKFAPDHAGLFQLTYNGEAARKRLAEIDKFEKTFDRDRREYERLKRKFEAGV